MKKITSINLLITLSISSLSLAQKLDLATCLKMADTANTTLRNAQLDVEMDARNRKAYLTARLPQLNFNADYKYNAIIPGQVVPGAFFGGAPGTYSTVQFGVPFNLSNTLQLSQVVYNPQIDYGLAVLRINSEIIGIQMKMANQEVKYQVASTFFNLQAIKKQRSYVDANLKNMEKLILNMASTVKQGLVVQTELDKLTISKMTLTNSANALTATHQQLESLLKILIGLKTDQPLEILIDETVEHSMLTDPNTANYPELELLTAQQKMNKEERKGTKMSYLPTFSMYAAYNYNYNMKPENNFRKGIEGAFVGLRVDWKLFDGMEKYHKQKVNALNAEKLSNQKQFLSEQLALNVANAKRQIEVQTGALNLSKEQLKLAQNIYDQAVAKLAAGTISSNDMIAADNGLQQAQTNLVSTYIQLRQAELDYLKATGTIN